MLSEWGSHRERLRSSKTENTVTARDSLSQTERPKARPSSTRQRTTAKTLWDWVLESVHWNEQDSVDEITRKTLKANYVQGFFFSFSIFGKRESSNSRHESRDLPLSLMSEIASLLEKILRLTKTFFCRFYHTNIKAPFGGVFKWVEFRNIQRMQIFL